MTLNHNITSFGLLVSRGVGIILPVSTVYNDLCPERYLRMYVYSAKAMNSILLQGPDVTSSAFSVQYQLKIFIKLPASDGC